MQLNQESFAIPAKYGVGDQSIRSSGVNFGTQLRPRRRASRRIGDFMGQGGLSKFDVSYSLQQNNIT
jgi:hypothetical protein